MHTKEGHHPANLPMDTAACSDTEQILHLKRLLVTLKQHYEKSLHTSNIQLQTERNQTLALQKELKCLQNQLVESQKNHEEELQALRNQQITLKELLKKGQDELKQTRVSLSPSHSDLIASHQRIEQLERLIPSLQNRAEEAKAEAEQLRHELERAQRKTKFLEQELSETKQKAQQESLQFQQLLEIQKQEEPLETVISPTSSHYLRRELEVIKRTLAQGTQETKALETRYAEILKEKIATEHHYQQLHLQFEHQSSNLMAFQTQLHEIEQQKKQLEAALHGKESELRENQQQQQELQKGIRYWEGLAQEREPIQDKYEQLKEEWQQLNDRLEEAVEVRTKAEQQAAQSENIAKEREAQFHAQTHHIQRLDQEKRALECDREQLKDLLGESEARLKIAQQHLAKKVKETTLLSAKVEEQQMSLTEYGQNLELQKAQLAQLQVNLELYQRQEKRLQEQLHEALKGTESQVAKWEEKYFRMYDKWQESEAQIRELKKFEERHHQIQSLFANLGTFIGSSFNSSSPFSHSGKVPTERPVNPLTFETPLAEETPPLASKIETQEENYDLFGMPQSASKYKSNLFP